MVIERPTRLSIYHTFRFIRANDGYTYVHYIILSGAKDLLKYYITK